MKYLNKHRKHIRLLSLFLIVFFCIFSLSYVLVNAEGQECDPNDAEAVCNNPGNPTPIRGNNTTPEYVTENWVNVSLGAPETVQVGQSFNVSWSAEWNTREGDDGRLFYRVTLFENGTEIKFWEVDSNSGNNPPESGSYSVNSGVTNNTQYQVVAEVVGVTEGLNYRDVEEKTVLISEIPKCTINSFTADNQSIVSGNSTNLRFSLSGNYSWSIRVLGGSQLTSGTGVGGIVSTGILSSTKTFRLTCNDSVVRDVIIVADDTPSTPTGTPTNTGGSGWCGTETSPPVGPRVEVPSSYTLIGIDDSIGDYSLSPAHIGVSGAVFNFTGTTRPPTGTNFVVLEINMDDGGTVSVNGTQVYSVSPTCSIKNNQIVVTNMNPGQLATINVSAVNSGLYGVGANLKFFYYNTGGAGGEDRTPSVTAPTCSNTNYSATISWRPINASVRIFVDDNPQTPEGFNKVIEGSGGSTNAPIGFVQRIPGGPETLVLEPGKTYYSFIQNTTTGDQDGNTVSWKVNQCSSSIGNLSANPLSCTIQENMGVCNTVLSWNTTNPIGTSAITKVPNITVTTGDSSPGTNVPVKYGGERFFLYNNGIELDYVDVEASCENGTVWSEVEQVCLGGNLAGIPFPPSITGLNNGIVNTSYTFTVVGNDPGGEKIRYGIDWKFANGNLYDGNSVMDGIADAWLPAGSSYVNSRSPEQITFSWTTLGSKKFQALTQDESGNNSSWTTHNIIISNANMLPDLTAGNVVPNSAYVGVPIIFSTIIRNIGN